MATPAYASTCNSCRPPPPPPAFAFEEAIVNGIDNTLNGFGTIGAQPCFGRGCPFDQATSSPNLVVSVSGFSPSNAYTLNASALLTYFYEVHAPAVFNGQQVTVHLHAMIMHSLLGPGPVYDATALFYGADSQNPQVLERPGSYNVSYDVPVNTVEQIGMVAQVQTGFPYEPQGAAATFSASIDPNIVIDAADLARFPGIQLIYSANIVVPEPATWTMMLAGLGALGAEARRRRLMAGSSRAATSCA